MWERIKQSLKIENLSLYRNEIYGISIIWIMLFHGVILPYVHLDEICFPLYAILKYGNVGVDIFLFLSGISCFFAYYGKEHYDVFFLKRLLRILPPYLVFGSINWFLLDILPGKGVSQYIKDLALYSFWNDGQDLFWYVALIMFLYILYPFIYNSIFTNGKPIFLSFYLWMITILTFNAYLKNFSEEIYENIEIAICRIPIFVCGCLAGYYVYFKKRFCYSFYIFCFILAVSSCYICNNGYLPILGFRYTYLFLGVGLSVIFASAFDLFHFEAINRILRFFGGMSLELYIVHIGLRKLFIRSYLYMDYCFTEYLGLLMITIVVAYILSKIHMLIQNYCLKAIYSDPIGKE